MKLLRTIRLDKSDTFVFERAAEAGEWASPGAFMFWDGDASKLQGKQRTALRSGFLGLSTFGWSTLVEVAEARPDEVAQLRQRLAAYLVREHGAPDEASALAAADEEISVAAGLAEQPLGMVIALQRTVDPDGALRERFRTIQTTLEPGANTFEQGCVQPIGFAREDGDGGLQGEEVDFVGLMGGKPAGEPGGGA